VEVLEARSDVRGDVRSLLDLGWLLDGLLLRAAGGWAVEGPGVVFADVGHPGAGWQVALKTIGCVRYEREQRFL